MDIAGAVNLYSTGIVVESLLNSKGAKSVGEIASDMLVDKKTIKDDISGTIIDQEDATAISSFASKLSAIDKELKASGNTEGQEGLRELAKKYASDPESFNNLIDSIDSLDSKSFQKVFSTIGEMSDEGIKPDEYLDTLTSISDDKVKKGFIDAAAQVVGDSKAIDEDKEDALDKLSEAVDAVDDMDLEDEEKAEKLTDLFNDISSSKTVSDASSKLDIFLNEIKKDK